MLTYALTVAERDPRIVRIEQRLSGLNKSQRWLARELGMSSTAVRYWISGATSPRNDNLLVQADEILNREEARKFSTSATLPGKKQTGVYYTEDQDSAFGIDVVVKAWVVSGSSEWSAKSVSVKTLIVSALPGAAGVKAVVKITEQFGAHKPGTVFFFKETDYPTEGVILLAEHHEDSDRKMLLVIEDGTESLLKEWKLTHYAFAKGWGAGDVVSDGQWAQGGIPFR